MLPSKIIFLDIDGVLVTKESFYNKPIGNCNYPQFDDGAVGQLNKLIKKTKAGIVISSTWRHGRTVSQLQEMLSTQGVVGKVIGKTASLPDEEYPRGQEILAWVKAQPHTIKHFVAIDDDSYDLLPVLPRNFVHVKNGFETGLLKVHIEQATEILTNGNCNHL